MAGLPQQDVIKYAEFLVEVWPERVIDMLSDQDVCRRDKIAEYYERLWPRLGDEHTVKGLLMRREFGQLRAIKTSRCGSPSTFSTPVIGTSGHPPPTPASSSVVSDSHSVNKRVDVVEWINVLQSCGRVQLTYRPSGSDLYFISQDMLHEVNDRPPTEEVERQEIVGGQIRVVNSYIRLSWHFTGNNTSHQDDFWILPSGTIKGAQVLIGHRREAHSHFAGHPSPLALSSHPPPPAPTPPMAHLRQGSSSGLPSPRSASHFDRHQYQSNYGPPPPFHHQPSAAMGYPAPGSHSSPSFHHQAPTAIPESPSQRPRHEQANRPGTSSVSRPSSASGNSVNMSFTYQGKSIGKRVRPISMTSTAIEAWDTIDKVKKRLIPASSSVDLSELEFRVHLDSQPATATDYYSLMQDDFLQCWDSVVLFVNKHRTTNPGVALGFTFDIS